MKKQKSTRTGGVRKQNTQIENKQTVADRVRIHTRSTLPRISKKQGTGCGHSSIGCSLG